MKNTSKRKPLFNVSIKIKGWEGPFQNLNYFLTIAQKAEDVLELNGNVHVLEGGQIAQGSNPNVHTYNGQIKIDEPTIHLHYDSLHCDFEQLREIIRKKNHFYLEGIAETAFPIYTLEGLYSTLESQNTETRIKALTNALETLTYFRASSFLKESVSIKKTTKLKLLEQKYKTLISNQ